MRVGHRRPRPSSRRRQRRSMRARADRTRRSTLHSRRHNSDSSPNAPCFVSLHCARQHRSKLTVRFVTSTPRSTRARIQARPQPHAAFVRSPVLPISTRSRRCPSSRRHERRSIARSRGSHDSSDLHYCPSAPVEADRAVNFVPHFRAGAAAAISTYDCRWRRNACGLIRKSRVTFTCSRSS